MGCTDGESIYDVPGAAEEWFRDVCRRRNETPIHRFGLELDQDAFDRLGESLKRINEAEREAGRGLT